MTTAFQSCQPFRNNCLLSDSQAVFDAHYDQIESPEWPGPAYQTCKECCVGVPPV